MKETEDSVVLRKECSGNQYVPPILGDALAFTGVTLFSGSVTESGVVDFGGG